MSNIHPIGLSRAQALAQEKLFESLLDDAVPPPSAETAPSQTRRTIPDQPYLFLLKVPPGIPLCPP